MRLVNQLGLPTMLLTCMLAGCGESQELAKAKAESEQAKAELEKLRAQLEAVKTSSETELTNAKAELAKAQSELESARFAKELLTAPDLPPIQRADSSWTPEQLIEAYLRAPSLEHRIPFVKDPARVRPLMNTYYANYRFEPITEFSILPRSETKTAFGESLVLKVERPTLPPTDYVIVQTSHGYRVDWEASRLEWMAAEEQAFRRTHGLVDATLEISLIRRRDNLDLNAQLTFQFTNRSRAKIVGATIECDGYDADNKFLNRGLVFLDEIPPEASQIENITLVDVEPKQLQSWRFNLKSLSIDVGNNKEEYVEKYFDLREVK